MKIIAFLLTLLVQVSYGQHVLVKSNGDQILLKKPKFNKDDIQIVDKDKEKILISVDSIVAIYDEAHQITYYNKPSDQGDGKMGDWRYQFIERVVVGKISLYKKIVATTTFVQGPFGPEGPFNHKSPYMNNFGPRQNEYYYIEKDNVLKCVFVTNTIQNKKDRFPILKSFVSDDPEILNKIDEGDFNFNIKNLVRIVKEFNLKNFEPAKSVASKLQNVGFYTRARETLKEQITLKVNDSLECKLPESQLPLPINLSLEKPSKVCVSWESGSVCEIISPSPFAVDYYELVYFAGDRSFEIEKKSVSEFKDYIVYVQKH